MERRERQTLHARLAGGSLPPGSNGPPGMLAAPSAAPLGSKWSSSIPQTSGAPTSTSRKTPEKPEQLRRGCRAKGRGGFSRAGNSLGRAGRGRERDLSGAAFKSQRCLSKEQREPSPGSRGGRRPSSSSRETSWKCRREGGQEPDLGSWGMLPREWQAEISTGVPLSPAVGVALPLCAGREAWTGSNNQNRWMWPRCLQGGAGIPLWDIPCCPHQAAPH